MIPKRSTAATWRPQLSTHAAAASFALFVLLVGPGFASAQTASDVSAPVAQGSTEVPYPEGARGEAAVVLELVVEADGTVSGATVIEGEEPFAEQARRAALAWHFDPARRGDSAVAARIRARVEFHEPPPARTPAPDGGVDAGPAPATVVPTPTQPSTAVPAPPAPSAAAALAPQEVVVRGSRREVGRTTLSASEVRELPGAFGDPFRAIEVLPGVTPMVSGIPYFYIRGAPPNDNGYFVDGVRVPLLFHIGIGEGVIHPGLIDHVDLYPGAPPAAYGRFAGGIVAGQTRDSSSTFHGEANLRLFDAGTLLEAPFADGRGSALVAGRYGYPGPILSAITSSVRLGYWDYQTRVAFRVGDRDTLGIFAFGSHDSLATKQSPSPAQAAMGATSSFVEQFASDFHRIDLRYDHRLDDGRIRAAATLGYDVQGGTFADGDNVAPIAVKDPSAALRVELDQKLSPGLRIRGGADGRIDVYSLDQSAAPSNQQPLVPAGAAPPPTNLTAGAYADVVWRVVPRVEIVPGVRSDLFESWRNDPTGGSRARTVVPAVDPRFAARITLTDSIAWLSTAGLSHQYPMLRVGAVPAPLVSVPGFPFGQTQLQTAAQASQGIELSLPGELVATATGFFAKWWGLTDLTATCFQRMPAMSMNAAGQPPPPEPYVCPDNQPVPGDAFGLELLVRRSISKRLSGFLSYTLSRSTRRAHFVTPAGGDAVAVVPSENDRTHVLNAALSYDLGRLWRAGARFMFYTGQPYSRLEGNLPVPPYNALRLPPFFRLDLRLEKRWRFGRDGSIAFVFEGQNVTLSKERTVLGRSCQGEGRVKGSTYMETTTCKPSSFGPITIPSIGVEAFF